MAHFKITYGTHLALATVVSDKNLGVSNWHTKVGQNMVIFEVHEKP